MNTSLLNARIGAGFTQKAVAKQAGISERHYQAIEYEEHEPRVCRALRIADVLHSTVEELFGELLCQRHEPGQGERVSQTPINTAIIALGKQPCKQHSRHAGVRTIPA